MTTLRIQLTPADYFDGTLLHLSHWSRQAGRAAGLAVLVIGGDLIVFAVAPGMAPNFANAALFYTGLVALSYAMQRIWLARRMRRLFKRPEFPRPYEFSFGNDGICTHVAGGTDEVAWRNIVKWCEDRHVFLLYRAAPLYFIVPKRAFRNARSRDEFRAQLHKNIGAAA